MVNRNAGICGLLVVVGVVLALVGSSTRAAAAPSVSGLEVTGYQSESSPTALITVNAQELDGVGVDGTTLLPSGRGIATTDPQALAQLRAAHAAHLPATLLISNFSDQINDFTEPVAHRLLGSATAMSTVAAELTQVVTSQGWDGITVDLESLTRRDERGLTAFVHTLRRDLPSRASLAVDVMNSTSSGQYPATGYDLSALARSATELVLMAYDEHGSWENTPGPVGALGWQKAGLAAVLRHVPASKLVLGVAGYGYAWEPHANVQVSDARARALAAAAGAAPAFDAKVGEWSAHLSDGTVIWWSDARSLALRLTLARQMHLRGVAIWDLALSDPLSGAV